MKTISGKFLKSAGKMLAVATFLLTFGLTQPVQAGAFGQNQKEETYNQVDKTPMYADPKYAEPNLNDAATGYDQKALNDDGGPNPPGEAEPNDTPVPSGVLPLLAMAFGLILWRVHAFLRKAKKAKN